MSWFRYASALAGLGAVPAAQSVLDRTESSARMLDDEDVRFERDRARSAVSGRYTSPVDTDQVLVHLPAVDANLPQVTPADVDELFDEVDRLLTERESLSG